MSSLRWRHDLELPSRRDGNGLVVVVVVAAAVEAKAEIRWHGDDQREQGNRDR